MINSATITITVILAILTIALPRKYFLATYVLATCFVPADQRVIIMDLDFTVLRILIVAGILRILIRNEYEKITWNKFDKLLFIWAVFGAAAYIAQHFSIAAVIYKSGILFDIVGLYCLFRQHIRSWNDIVPILKLFAVCAVLLAPFTAVEWTTGRNPFILLGTVHTALREGRFRCQSSFPHSIIFGVFWANLVPIFIALTAANRWKSIYWLSVAAAVFMVISTRSSTPYGTLMFNLALLSIFSLRRYGRYMALGFCGLTAALHIVMRAPVWQLIARIRIVSGSTGWHRYRLINETIKHFSEWALLGTSSTIHWGLTDITNQYCLEAVRSGLITLLLFVALLIMAIRTAGRFSLQNITSDKQWLAWGICVSILGHCVAFIGVSYFGQIHMLLYLTLAIVSAMYEMQETSLQLAQSINPKLIKFLDARFQQHIPQNEYMN
jgi:hypothetical protein